MFSALSLYPRLITAIVTATAIICIAFGVRMIVRYFTESQTLLKHNGVIENTSIVQVEYKHGGEPATMIEEGRVKIINDAKEYRVESSPRRLQTLLSAGASVTFYTHPYEAQSNSQLIHRLDSKQYNESVVKDEGMPEWATGLIAIAMGIAMYLLRMRFRGEISFR